MCEETKSLFGGYLMVRNSAIRLFLVLSEMNDMYFCPILPGMIIMLLTYLSEEEVYCVSIL